jgi:hypothetical protein
MLIYEPKEYPSLNWKNKRHRNKPLYKEKHIYFRASPYEDDVSGFINNLKPFAYNAIRSIQVYTEIR